MICLSLESVGLSFGATDILKDVSFHLNDGDRLGIVGVNGAGKSTLLKIICASLEPTQGHVYFAKNKTMGFLSQNALLREEDGESSVYDLMLSCYVDLLREEALLAEWQTRMDGGDLSVAESYAVLHEQFTEKGGYSFRGRLRGLLRSLGFAEEDFTKPVKLLSGGQKTRLALGRVLYAEPDLLILDEPTNHLDLATLQWLEDYLRTYKKTVILVSHDRYFLDRVVTKILDIEHGKARLYTGNYSSFAEQKKKDREIQERHYRNQQKEIARIEAYIEQQRRWNRERNIIAAESRQKQLDKLEREERPENLPENIRLCFQSDLPSGEDVLSVKGLCKSFGEKRLFEGLSFEVKRGDRLLITGGNGCGKSTLLKILMGRIPSDRGSFHLGYHVQIGYYDQENQNLRGDNTVLDELWDAYGTLSQTQVRSTLALFRFTGDDVMKRVCDLSGGERARLTFAKLSLSKTNLLILDEPTNHLDIGTREVLEEALSAYDGTIVAVSHDRYFISRLANRMLDFSLAENDSAPFYFDGSYEEYQDYLRRRQESGESQTDSAVAEKTPLSAGKAQYLQNKKAASELRKLKSRLREATASCTKLEEELEQIDARCEANPTDHVLLTQLYGRKEELEEALLSLYEQIEILKEQLPEEV